MRSGLFPWIDMGLRRVWSALRRLHLPTFALPPNPARHCKLVHLSLLVRLRKLILPPAIALLPLVLLLPTFANSGRCYATPSVRGEGRLAWFTFITDHFVVHYPVSRKRPGDIHAVNGARLAQRAGNLAESSYEKLLEALGVAPPGPIHLVLNAHLNHPKGRAEPQWMKIQVSTTPGPAFPLRGEDDWLGESIAHELSHLMMVYAESAMAPGRSAVLEARIADRNWLGRAFGSSIPLDPEAELGFRISMTDPAPFFWVEGGAEFLAEVAGYNHWTTGRDMLLRTSTLEDLLLSPDDLQSSLGRMGFDGERGYNQGYSFMIFLKERYGEQAFYRILKAAASRYRWNWIKAIEAGQGIAFETLYQHWKEWLEERYRPLADAKSKEVRGEELLMVVPPWRSPDLEVRRRWLALPRDQRREERQGGVLEANYPTWSPDGKLLASWENGLKVRGIPEGLWPAYGGRPLEAYRDRLELARRQRRLAYIPQVRQFPLAWSPDGKRLVVVAGENWRLEGGQGKAPFNWNALFLLDVRSNDQHEVKISVPEPGGPIPNTQRGQDPAWSPNGKWITFVRFVDGTANLWIVKPDGSDARALTSFVDGTTLGHPSWSPDSSQIVFHMYRRKQRDLWLYDFKDHKLHPVGLDAADDLDPYWARDGKIYYSSDANDIFNLYAYDPDTLEVRRLTDVMGGAFSPQVSPSGSLVFVYFDGYAFKLYGLKASKALAVPVDNAAYFVDPSLTESYLLGAGEAPGAVGSKYRILRGARKPAFIPTLRITEKDVQGGARLEWEDPLKRHHLRLEGLAGMGTLLHANYTYNRWQPSLELGALSRSSKESVVLRTEAEGETFLAERKREQMFRLAYLNLGLEVGSSWSLGAAFDARALSFRQREDGSGLRSLYDSVGGGPQIEYSSFVRGSHGAEGIDPRGGFRGLLRYSLRQSRVRDPVTSEPIVEAGESLSTYVFHRFELELQQALALPWGGHSLEWNLNFGMLDRNVAWWDELKAGSALALLNPVVDPVVPFPGYADSSLSGETLGVLGVAYRFPINAHFDRVWGPLYLDGVYLQTSGTIGNVWGYTLEGDGNRREMLLEEAPTRNAYGENASALLAEVGLELRVSSSLFSRYRWASFVRLGYALNDVTGVGDVDGDGAYPGEYGDLIPTAGGEMNPRGLRLAVGLGTGF